MKTGKSVREAFGLALAKVGQEFSDIVVVDGDVHNSTRTEHFAKKFPERFFNVGIAESNLVGAAAGMASAGKRAWLASFAAFVMCNAYDQLRMSVAFPCLDVKVVGTHAGISIGEDGPSQMGIEDVALACALPNFTVVVPADEHSMTQAVNALGKIKTPAYLRAGRPNVPAVYDSAKAAVEAMTRNMAFELGPHGITVNCVAPGNIADRPGTTPSPWWETSAQRIPFRRVGRAADIAAAVRFFCLPETEFTTGQTLLVDGAHDSYLPEF